MKKDKNEMLEAILNEKRSLSVQVMGSHHGRADTYALIGDFLH